MKEFWKTKQLSIGDDTKKNNHLLMFPYCHIHHGKSTHAYFDTCKLPQQETCNILPNINTIHLSAFFISCHGHLFPRLASPSLFIHHRLYMETVRKLLGAY